MIFRPFFIFKLKGGGSGCGEEVAAGMATRLALKTGKQVRCHNICLCSGNAGSLELVIAQIFVSCCLPDNTELLATVAERQILAELLRIP